MEVNGDTIQNFVRTPKLEKEIESSENESQKLLETMKEMVRESGRDSDINALIDSGYLDLKNRYEDLNKIITGKNAELKAKNNRAVECKAFLSRLEKIEEPVCEFSEELWVSLVGKAVVGESGIEFLMR